MAGVEAGPIVIWSILKRKLTCALFGHWPTIHRVPWAPDWGRYCRRCGDKMDDG